MCHNYKHEHPHCDVLVTCEESVSSSIRGYHVYKVIIDTCHRTETWMCQGPINMTDKYAVSVVEKTIAASYLARKILRLCWLFLCYGGIITCEITKRHQCSSDLIGGFWVIHYWFVFFFTKKRIDRMLHSHLWHFSLCTFISVNLCQPFYQFCNMVDTV